ncbi:conjugal transfer protein TraB [Micromonospora sp. NPDC049230]|uniref:conjugal transfer protein TraB n=1 Tax=Micromonospora sp. NPDC049230 TaxID=3155502 RepID=UPI0033EEB570
MVKTTTRMPKNAGYDGVATVHTVKLPLWPYLVTPVSAVAALPITWGAHHWYGNSPWTGVALAAADATVTGFTWWAARPRGPLMQSMSTGLALAGSAWTTMAVIEGPWSRGMFGVWFIGTVVGSVVVGVRRIMHKAGGDGDEASAGGLADAVKSLRGARLGRTTIDGARATATVVLESGTTASDLAADRGALASALDVPATAVRVIPNPDSARRAKMSVVPVDQLRETRYWPGPSAPGASIADAPIRLGVIEDGEPLDLWLPGDHKAGRNSAHLSVVGMSGAGKTELVLNLCADVLTRNDVRLVVTDTRKGDQLPEWLRLGAHETYLTPESAEDYIEDLPRLIAERARHLGQRGLKQWVKGCGLPYLVLVNFEAARLVADSSSFVDVTESARSVGIFLLVELQRATHDRFPTSARANISAKICLGVERDTDAEAALSERTLDAGAAPWEWKNSRPGYLYAEFPGVDPERWSMPARAFIARSEEDRAAAIAPFRPVAVSAPAARPAPVQRQEGQPVKPRDDQDDERELNQALNLAEPPDDVDPAQPIEVPADMPRLAFGQLRKPPMGTAEARAWMRDYLLRLPESGTTAVSPAELGDVIEATGLTASWVGKELRRLCSGPDAILRKTDRGVYKIRVAEPA